MISNKVSDYFLNVFVTKKRYVYLGIIEIFLFVIYYYIVSPSNFSSFSDTLRYYISILGTLLAIVVSFNTFALQNQLKDMPINLKNLENQLNKIDTLKESFSLTDSTNNNESNQSNSENINYNYKFTELFKAIDNYPDVLLKLINNIKSLAIHTENNNRLESKTTTTTEEIKKICKDINEECNYRLDLYMKYKSPYNFIRLNSASFVVKLNILTKEVDNSQINNLYESIKRLHIFRNICSRIFIRHSLTNLSYELFVSSIPIIAFIGAIASISNYNIYNTFLLRILFTISISIAILPFIILFIRIIPILYLVKDISTIPFGSKRDE